MKLNFDVRGNLEPYQRTVVSYNDFKECFVDQFPGESTRHQLFEQYKRYTQEYTEKITGKFKHWINGSFVSRKVNPMDIDLVNLIDYRIVKEKEGLIRSNFVGSTVHREYGIDAYLVIIYPENHTLYRWTKSDLFYWNDWFTRSKIDRPKKRYAKGYVEINFKTPL
ncbi:MAG: hypothetical protein WA960_15855 [Tunicatimonas sp.]